MSLASSFKKEQVLLCAFVINHEKKQFNTQAKFLITKRLLKYLLATPTDELINVDNIDPETATLISVNILSKILFFNLYAFILQESFIKKGGNRWS